MKRWLLRQLGVIHALHVAELEILEGINQLGIDKCCNDEITDIVMAALAKIRNGGKR